MEFSAHLRSAGIAWIALFLVCAVSAQEPSFIYETTIPGYTLDSGRGVAVDTEGNAHVFARAIGEFQQNNLIVIKLDAAGDVLWIREIAGQDHDVGTDIALNADGDVYVTGWTDSGDFPITPDALQSTSAGFRDVFVMILSGVDGEILYSTLLGGDYTDQGGGIALGANEEIYLAGTTTSMDFPTVDPLQGGLNGSTYAFSDAFVTKLSADGQTILYSTYLGGGHDEGAQDIELDADGSIYIAGTTHSSDYPTQNPIQATLMGAPDLFATKISAAGDAILYSTYLGGEDVDRFGGMTVGPEGAMYLGGITRSIHYPTTPGAFQEEFVGEILGCEIPFGGRFNCEDMTVSKLAPAGDALVYSTYIGGSRPDECRDLAIDSQGCAYVVGYTSSEDFPPEGIDTSAEIVVAKLSADGSELVYSVTVDSGSANAGHGIAIDAQDDVYFSGATQVPADTYVAKLSGGTSGVGGSGGGGGKFTSVVQLGGSRPNPFGQSTRLSFAVETAGGAPVTLAIYDATGRRVRTLVEGRVAAGMQTARWDGTDQSGRSVPSGVYYYELRSNGSSESRPVLLVR